MRRLILILLFTALAAASYGQGAQRMQTETGPKTVIGPSNLPLHDGAQALLAGDVEEGLRLTLAGLKIATNKREEEAALSNLCAGYIMLDKLEEALRYCEMLLVRNDENWRAYNNRAVIYIKMKKYELAEQDLVRGEELKPNAHTLKVARAMYMDAVHPVAPEVTVDDRDKSARDDSQR